MLADGLYERFGTPTLASPCIHQFAGGGTVSITSGAAMAGSASVTSSCAALRSRRPATERQRPRRDGRRVHRHCRPSSAGRGKSARPTVVTDRNHPRGTKREHYSVRSETGTDHTHLQRQGQSDRRRRIRRTAQALRSRPASEDRAPIVTVFGDESDAADYNDPALAGRVKAALVVHSARTTYSMKTIMAARTLVYSLPGTNSDRDFLAGRHGPASSQRPGAGSFLPGPTPAASNLCPSRPAHRCDRDDVGRVRRAEAMSPRRRRPPNSAGTHRLP